MNTDCVLCNPNQDPEQQIILENDHCFYIQKSQ